MSRFKYLGHLSDSDPFYGYLFYEILPQIGFYGDAPYFKVYGVAASNHVYIYEEARSRIRVIGKFFGNVANRSLKTAEHLMEREFNNLHYLRHLGFTGYPHYIARALGKQSDLNCVLVVEFCYGTALDEIIIRAIREGNQDLLYQKLTALAYFLAAMHNRTAITDSRVEFRKECSYFDKIVRQLTNHKYLEAKRAQELTLLKSGWAEKGCMWEDRQVVVHGDVTPDNILFGDGLWVIVIDLERMKRADRVFDLGRLAGELKHFFMQYLGNGDLAEPFIGHFLWEYACHFPDREGAFSSITLRVPFYMGLNLLRIARNFWVTPEHRKHLIREACRIMRG